jgi:hypothetical protein
VQRLVSTDRRKQHNDVAGFIYAVLGQHHATTVGHILHSVQFWAYSPKCLEGAFSDVAPSSRLSLQ